MQALAKEPGAEAVHFDIGVVYERMKDTDKSLEHMKKVLEANPENPHALNYIGYAYAEQGIKLDEAEKAILKALKLRPRDGYITDSLGWVYFKKGMYKKALDQLKKAVTLAPEDPVINEHLGDAYRKLGQIDEARKMYEKAISLNKEETEKQNLQNKIDEMEKMPAPVKPAGKSSPKAEDKPQSSPRPAPARG